MAGPNADCLRAPLFLGVHTLSLKQELTLDGGRLRLWAGAAHHGAPTEDSAAELLRGFEREYSKPCLTPHASGSRQIGGPFLRAQQLGEAAPDDFEHIWLEVGEALPGATALAISLTYQYNAGA